MTSPSLSNLESAYEAWLMAPTRRFHLRAPPNSNGPGELDVFSFEEGGDEPVAFIATSGMSTVDLPGPIPRVELVLSISAAIDEAEFQALAARLGELSGWPFRERSRFAPNMVVGPFPLPLFEGKPFLLLGDFKMRLPDYLPVEPLVRLLRVTPLTEAEAAIARDIGDVDTYHRFQIEGIPHEDPRRPEARLSDPVPVAPEPPVHESIGEIWAAIDGWLRVHAVPTLKLLRPGAADAAIADLERQIGMPLPADYVASLRHHDGGANLTDYEYLSVAQVASVWQSKQKALDEGVFIGRDVEGKGGGVVRNFWWHPGWIPFAQDSVGNLLCIDTVPGWSGTRGQVIHWERSSGPFGGRHRSFRDWLRTYRDELLAGQTYEVDVDGLIHVKV